MANLSVKYLNNLTRTIRQLGSSFNSIRSISTTNPYFQVSTTSRRQNKAAVNTDKSVIPPPSLDGELKAYPKKIQDLVDEISQLTLVEVSDLNELLRKKLNIKDTPMYATQAPANLAEKSVDKVEEEPEAPKKTEKSTFTLKIVKFDETKKVALIKEVKALSENMNLVQAKKLIETLPNVFRQNIAKDEMEKVKDQLEKAGAICEVE
jgi:large subunit ribosomal protein L7/L12